ncbi:RIO2 family protein [Microbacterium xylanilyticum]
MIRETDAAGGSDPVASFLPSVAGYRWDPNRHVFEHRYDRDLQLIAIWSRARVEEQRILDLVADEFQVLARYEVHWTPERVENNFERLYATGVGLGSFKGEDAGVGPFILVIAEDLDPVYQYRRNVSGFLEVTNVRVARVKRTARELVGGYSVHSSNGLAEFFRDATLLLGPGRLDALLARDAPGTPPPIEQLNADLVGADGWADFDEVVQVLRRTVEYVVLRNFDGLPGLLDTDPEIDVLARDQLDFAAVVNAAKVHPDSGAAFRTTVGGRPVVFDVRWVGDGYLDARWQDRILAHREVPQDAVARPRLDDHFFSLLYHAKIQKPQVKPAYVKLLASLAGELDLPADLTDRVTEDGVAAAALDGYLSGSGFIVPQPDDEDVHRNAAFTDLLRMSTVAPDADQLVRRQLWRRARYSRVGSWAAESDRMRAAMRGLRRLRRGPASDAAAAPQRGFAANIPPADSPPADSTGQPPSAPIGRPPRTTEGRTLLSRVRGRIALVRRYRVPVFSHFAKDTETSATVFLTVKGQPLVGKYFTGSPRARAELRAERRSWELFRDRPWRMPVARWRRRSMLVRRLPDDSRLDVRARSMNDQERLDIAVWALDVLLDIYLAGYLHGDLQPHNVWYLDGRPVVTDWSTFARRSADVPFLESADLSGYDPAYEGRFDPAFDPVDRWSFQNAVGVTSDEAVAALRARLVRAAEHSAYARERLDILDGRSTAVRPVPGDDGYDR